MLDYNQIKELIKEIDSSSIKVFELDHEGVRLKLNKNTVNDSNEYRSDKVNDYSNENRNNDRSNYKEDTRKINVTEEKNENCNLIKSPIVGTYYESSTPDGDPFVKIGSKVKKGDVLCIIEAMKVMNEVTSQFDGEIIEILRSNEDMVEFGMELFKIK